MIHTKRKTIIGIVLIVLSLAALIFWEVSGRELCTSKEVAAAAVSLKAGDTLGPGDLAAVRLPSEGAAKSWLSVSEAAMLTGRICAVDIGAGEPLTEAMFRVKNEVLSDGRSIFRIPGEWIASRPSMLRAGDTITLYSLPEESEEGTFEIAFARDSAEQAVTGDEISSSDVLSRETSGSIIDSVEIICTADDFFRLYELSLTSGHIGKTSPGTANDEQDPAAAGGPSELWEDSPAIAEGAGEGLFGDECIEEPEEYGPGEPFLLLVLRKTR